MGFGKIERIQDGKQGLLFSELSNIIKHDRIKQILNDTLWSMSYLLEKENNNNTESHLVNGDFTQLSEKKLSSVQEANINRLKRHFYEYTTHFVWEFRTSLEEEKVEHNFESGLSLEEETIVGDV